MSDETIRGVENALETDDTVKLKGDDISYLRSVVERFTKKAVLAGVLIGLGALFCMRTSNRGYLVMGVCFSIGLFAVLASGAHLFTGKLSLVCSIFEGKDKLGETKKVVTFLSYVWVCNLIGAIAISMLGTVCGIDAYTPSTLRALTPAHLLFVRGILCNVLISLAVYLYKRSDKTIISAALVSLAFVTCFVVCVGEHCVADMVYMISGLLQNKVTLLECVRVIGLATLGNIVGGMAFSWLVWERR